jgi:energy-coupling factor transporter ATP-binding protein EcfA2
MSQKIRYYTQKINNLLIEVNKLSDIHPKEITKIKEDLNYIKLIFKEYYGNDNLDKRLREEDNSEDTNSEGERWLLNSNISASIKEQYKILLKKVNELKKINKNPISRKDHYKFIDQQKLPTSEQILRLWFVPYVEKRELLNDLQTLQKLQKSGESIEANKDLLVLKESIIFKYNNWIGIKSKENQEKYKQVREIKKLSYNDVLNNNEISDYNKSGFINRMNSCDRVLTVHADKGIRLHAKLHQEVTMSIDHGTDEMLIIKKIKESHMTEHTKKLLLQKLSNCDSDSKIIEYINTVINIPHNIKQLTIPDNYTELYTKIITMLDAELWGLTKIKEELATTLCNKFLLKNTKYKGLALVGPPGTGKTTIVKTLAKVLGIPFTKLSINAMSSGSALSGHDFTYHGSTPGAIVKALCKWKCKNGLLLLDEFDKASDNSHDSVQQKLVDICDFTQNDTYHDNYIGSEIDIDLSKIFLVCTLNDDKQVGRILGDRVKPIQIEAYTEDEKIHIGIHMIKNTMEELEIPQDQVLIPRDMIKMFIRSAEENDKIRGYKHEELGGVRGLDTIIKHILERIKILIETNGTKLKNMSYSTIDNFQLPYTLNHTDFCILIKYYGIKDDLPISARNMYM